ncbi:MAG: hypothetical protein DWI09_04960 [Planctomycetota bacterium]|jgi:hypothetical protein|nr:MAG: hypothetical protein DWI09_04960 [Planctomycetota bacterium]RLS99433.1 MAG: hypothetical protein DWI16_01600 [Planctomycetota bacterium]
MLKLLRQYNQWILVVGGTLLLIAFLMPSAIQGLARQSAVSGALWATYRGGDVTGADRDEAQQELRVIELMPNQILSFLGADKDPAHWWLLVHEATEAGLVGGDGDGVAALEQIASNAKIAPEQVLFNLARASGSNRDVVLAALAKVQGVSRLVNLSLNVDRVSDRRLKQSVARSLLAVSGDMIVLDARSNSVIEAAAPSDDRLTEHLKKYADTVRPADALIGADKFGYRIPDHFKVEWLSISKSAVAASMANSPELTTLALKKRFAQNPSKYGGGAGDGANFAALEIAVRTAVTEELVKARMDEIAKFASDQLGLAQRTLKRDGSHFVLPAEWSTQMPQLQALAQTIAAEFSISAPSYQSSGESWISTTELAAIPGLGTAKTAKFGTPLSAPQLAAVAKELSTPSIATPFQVNIASPAMIADGGDAYFFRMIAAEASKQADDLAAVRANVEKDLIALDRFQWLEANKDALAAEAARDGIRAVATKYGVKVEFAKDVAEANAQFIQYGIRMGAGLPSLNNDPKAIAAIIEKAAPIAFAADMSAIPLADRTIAVAVPDKLSLVLMQVTAKTPVTEEKFSELASALMGQSGSRLVNVTSDPTLAIDPKSLFGFDALAKRYSFKPTREKDSPAMVNEPNPPLDPAT